MSGCVERSLERSKLSFLFLKFKEMCTHIELVISGLKLSGNADGVVINATKLELAVWSDFLRDSLLSATEDSLSEIEIANADSEVVATLVRSLYEKEVPPLILSYIGDV